MVETTRRRGVGRILGWVLGGLAVALLSAIAFLRCQYGGGRPYPDTTTAPLVPAERLETVVELPLPPGNVAVSATGRVFFDLHPFGEPARFSDAVVYELVDGVPEPYPDLAMQAEFAGVLGLHVDAQERLWMIRPAGIEDRSTRLFGFDLRTDTLVFDHAFDDGIAPFAQDLRVTPDGHTMILADTGIFRFTAPALVVFDLERRAARRVLEGHPSVSPQDWVIQSADGPHRMAWGLVTFAVGVDGIAISRDGAWLYYATMTHDSAFRVPIAALRDPGADDAALSSAIERVGSKPLSDGIELDAAGNLYLTDVEHGGIARLSPDGELRTLVRRDDIVWADGVAWAPDGSLLFTDSAIPSYLDPWARPPTRARLDRRAPHRIHRVRP